VISIGLTLVGLARQGAQNRQSRAVTPGMCHKAEVAISLGLATGSARQASNSWSAATARRSTFP